MAERIKNAKDLEGALRKAASAPPQEAAAPNLEEAVTEYAGTKATEATQAEDTAARIALARKEIGTKGAQSDKAVQFLAETQAAQEAEAERKLSLTRDNLDWWAKQNKWATGVGAGSLLLNVLAVEEQKKKQEGRDAAVLDLAEKHKEMGTKTTDFYKNLRSDFDSQTEFRKLKNAFNSAQPGQSYVGLSAAAPPKPLFVKPEWLFEPKDFSLTQ